MPRIPIKVIRPERKPYQVRMTRALARRLGAYAPGISLWSQVNRGASNLPIIIVAPILHPDNPLPDGGSVLIWNIREDDEGDIKRKPTKESA